MNKTRQFHSERYPHRRNESHKWPATWQHDIRLDLNISIVNTFGFGAELTILRSWPRVIESSPMFAA